MPPVTVTIEGETIQVPQYLHAFAYLARTFKVGDARPVDLFLTVSLNEALEWLELTTPVDGSGDVAMFDIQFVPNREPTLIKTMPPRQRRM